MILPNDTRLRLSARCSVEKKDGETKLDIVRSRVVFVSTAERRYHTCRRKIDVLFADVVSPEVVMMPHLKTQTDLGRT